jgi:hypothetical protein
MFVVVLFSFSRKIYSSPGDVHPSPDKDWRRNAPAKGIIALSKLSEELYPFDNSQVPLNLIPHGS